MEMRNFEPESRDMAIVGKSPCQKVVKLHLHIAITFEILLQNK